MNKLRKMRVRAVKCLNVVLIACTFVLLWTAVFRQSEFAEFTASRRLLSMVTCTCLYIFLGRTYEAFSLGTER
ncbi:MAG: hypothetical protein ACI4L8_06815, partial [Candidatus Fimadaptatus sp.]